MNILSKSKNLSRISFHKETTECINFMESLVNGRIRLKHLELELYNEVDEDDELIGWDQEKIDECIPAKNIETFDLRLSTSKPKIVTLYIMHKFPKLKRINLDFMDNSQADWLSEDDPPLFKRLCDFSPLLAKVKNLHFNIEIIWEMLEYYLDSRKCLKPLSLEIRLFTTPDFADPVLQVDGNEEGCSITVLASEYHDRMPVETFAKYGKYIVNIHLELDVDDSPIEH